MHELSLYGSVPADRYERLLQQLAGVTCMQPQHVEEIHLIFKSRAPPGLAQVQGTGGTQGISQHQHEVQRLRTMLQAGIYYVQLVGTLTGSQHSKDKNYVADVEMKGVSGKDNRIQEKVSWTFEFKDTPEAGEKQAVTSRLTSRTPLQEGDLMSFMDLFGFDYVARYYIVGELFYTQETTMFLHRGLQLPQVSGTDTANASDTSRLPATPDLQLLDPSGGYMLQATIDIVDGNIQELRDGATRQLLNVRDTLKQAVKLAPTDRLALNTRITIPLRQL